jgi:hypothetical protein
MAVGFQYGGEKYGRGNYRNGPMRWTRLAAAALRHIYQWLFIEDIDKESGVNHIGLALCSLCMLAFQIKRHPAVDDRNLKPLDTSSRGR